MTGVYFLYLKVKYIFFQLRLVFSTKRGCSVIGKIHFNTIKTAALQHSHTFLECASRLIRAANEPGIWRFALCKKIRKCYLEGLPMTESTWCESCDLHPKRQKLWWDSKRFLIPDCWHYCSSIKFTTEIGAVPLQMTIYAWKKCQRLNHHCRLKPCFLFSRHFVEYCNLRMFA